MAIFQSPVARPPASGVRVAAPSGAPRAAAFDRLDEPASDSSEPDRSDSAFYASAVALLRGPGAAADVPAVAEWDSGSEVAGLEVRGSEVAGSEVAGAEVREAEVAASGGGAPANPAASEGWPQASKRLWTPAPEDAGEHRPPVDAPRAPVTLADTGLAADQVFQLIMKVLYAGEASGLTLAERLCLPFQILESLIERSRAEQLIEVRGAIGTGAATYRYALTDAGRVRARQFLDANGYVGPAPVPLDAYVAAMKTLRDTRGFVNRERIHRGFEHLVVHDALFEQLGPAINAGKAVFLYGPAGNGKTVLAEGMGRTLGGEMFIPHAIDVDGQIITLYDPISHRAIDEEPRSSLLLSSATHDRRWVKIRRPVVTVGGELTLDMLDLTFNPIAKSYDAPIQLKANGGVFLVDDFGRQRMRPEELLNRWIVPLESRVDYLTLHTGKKFQVPFDVLIVFATNLDPKSLADEAFLRRIPYKIAITDPTVEQFTQIFELDCRRRKLSFHPVMVAYLYRRHYRPYGRAMRSCQPRDLLDQVTALCRFEGREPVVTRELLDKACEAYFLDDETGVSSAPPSKGATSKARRSRRQVEIR